MLNENPEQKQNILDTCPHCGHRLSPWQQVLLSVDRALTCKNCWYRIILDVFEEESEKPDENEEKKKTEGK
jgi:DNA-directed RNA polymerase subunit RPC12/RpoP